MDFYESVSAYYDLIFPVDPQTTAFLSSRVGPHSLILDIACGTGGYSLALAEQGQSGPYYDLSIYGVQKDKTAAVMDNKGDQIFIPLSKTGKLDGNVKISLVAGKTFKVLDPNGFDHDGAIIQVPHGNPSTVCFEAYALDQGSFAGSGAGEPSVLLEQTADGDLLYLDRVEFGASRGNDLTNSLEISEIIRVSGCIDENENGLCDGKDDTFNRSWIFNLEELMGYLWDYTSDDMKLLQIRLVDCSADWTVTDYDPTFKSEAQTETSSWGAMKSLYK